MSRIFKELIGRSRRISRDDFAANFGGIADDVVEMLESDAAKRIIRAAREAMERANPLPNGGDRLRAAEFGRFSTAVELEQGLVAAVDGTPVLPVQMYSAGQALCVGIGSITHRRPMKESLHYWSSRAYMADAESADDWLARQEEGIFGISQTAYLRYFEIKHGIEIPESLVLFDGTLVYEWLVATREGVNLYLDLFNSGKKALGVMKNVKANALFATFGRALRTGEIYVIETLADHLDQSNVANRNRGESATRYTLPEFHREIAPKIYRGIFKPSKKVFGFEVHEDHLDDMLRILCADCQMNNVGHEIPYLLNRVDEEVKRQLNATILRDRISFAMTTRSEELFFEETGERQFR